MTSRTHTWLRIAWIAAVLAVAFTLPARADTPLQGAVVRIQTYALEVGWHEGRVTRAPNGCTVVELAAPTADGHSSVMLAAIDWLEVRRGASWSYVVVDRILQRDPSSCHTA